MERELIGERTEMPSPTRSSRVNGSAMCPMAIPLIRTARPYLKIRGNKGYLPGARLHGKGYTYRGICRELIAMGYEAKEGTWHHQKVKNILGYQERRCIA